MCRRSMVELSSTIWLIIDQIVDDCPLRLRPCITFAVKRTEAHYSVAAYRPFRPR
jgi:hypothetical protein